MTPALLAHLLAAPLTPIAWTDWSDSLFERQHSAQHFALGEAERRQRGIPRVDTHLYARENAWAVTRASRSTRPPARPSR